jgi:hypothetical protein
MLDLLFTVSLDSLEECLQTLLMLLAQFFHLTHQVDLKVLFHDLGLELLLLTDHVLHGIGFIVVLD